MIEVLVTSAGLLFRDAELLWIRSHDPADSAQVIQGGLIDSVQTSSEQWLYFAISECLEWDSDALGCLTSRMQVDLSEDVPYDLVAWTEAPDRRVPEREMVPIATGWPFDAADINMDGAVACDDCELFMSAPYDWNLDGQVTAEDLNQLVEALAASRADLNGDGVVGPADLLILMINLGCTAEPGSTCPGDLDCDGTTGVQDGLLLLAQMGT